MIASPFSDTSALPAVREPRLKIGVQSASGGGGGGLGGVSGLVPGAGGGVDPWVSHLVSLRLRCGVSPFVDHAVLVLLSGEGAPQASAGDDMEIGFGFDDAGETALFTGTVSRKETTLQGYTRIVAVGPAHRLARARVNASFEVQSGGDIVRALAAEAGVTTGDLETGLSYPFYVVDDRRSLWEHLWDLSEQNQWLCFIDSEGRLTCRKSEGSEVVRTFRYGADIASLSHWLEQPRPGGVKVIGAGAAPSEGSKAWSWLTKAPKVVKEAGDGAPLLLVSRPVLRDMDGALSLASSVWAAVQSRAETIRVLVPAAPDVAVGTCFEVQGCPDGAWDGTYDVRSAEHCFDLEAGHASVIEGCKRPAGGGLGGLL